MIMRRALTGVLVAALVVLGACTSTTTSTPTPVTPAPVDLLAASAAAMAEVTSAGFTMTVDNQLSAVPVRSAQGSLTAAGDAQGSATISQFGQLVEVEFVLVGGDLYLKGITGGFSKVPAALAGQIYDPSAILDPNRGVAKVLSSVQNPTITGSEGGAWTVTGTVPADVAGGLVPGISTDVDTQLSIEMSGSQLTAATFTLPGDDGNPAKVAVQLSDFNEPVSISPPG